MSKYIDITVLDSGKLRLEFSGFSDADGVTSVKKCVPISSIDDHDLLTAGYVTIQTSRGRVWSMSCLPEYTPDMVSEGVYPIRNWNDSPVATNLELYEKIEAL